MNPASDFIFDPSTPPLLPGLESRVIEAGPRLLARWMAAAPLHDVLRKRAKVGGGTLAIWSMPPEPVPGMTPWAVRWAGYSGPFPGLDRVTEAAYAGESFIGALARKLGGVDAAVARLKDHSFTLGAIGLLNWAPRRVGAWRVPGPVRRWWLGAHHYPPAWTKLDRLAVAQGYPSWLAAVLTTESHAGVPLPLPAAAFPALLHGLYTP